MVYALDNIDEMIVLNLTNELNAIPCEKKLNI